MDETTTVARPYAEAIAHLAKSANGWQSWSDMLALAARAAADPQIADLITNPGVSAQTVADIIVAACGDGLNAEGANFVHLLAENKRFTMLPEIGRLFESLKADAEGVLEANIATAYSLSAEQMAGLVAKLEAKLGRKIEASQHVEPDLIGGVVIQVGDEVMDASVRGKLADLTATLNA